MHPGLLRLVGLMQKSRMGVFHHAGSPAGLAKQYIAEEREADHLAGNATRTELRKLGRDIAALMRKLAMLEARKAEIEKLSGTSAGRGPGRAVRG